MKNVTAGRIGGFTLIELLVVVLIIGILASVALPQYEKAVWKSRISGTLPILKSVAQAQEIYYMANGRYATDFDELDITVPNDFKDYNNYCYQSSGANVFTVQCGGGNIGWWVTLRVVPLNPTETYEKPYAGKLHCEAFYEKAKYYCANMMPGMTQDNGGICATGTCWNGKFL